MKTNKPVNLKSKGYFDLAVKKADGSLVEEKCLNNIENVVTYDGAYQILILGSNTQGIGSQYKARAGTSSTERVRTDTDLGAPLTPYSSPDGFSRLGNEVDNLDGTSTLTATREMSFAVGEITGTISEIGVYIDSGSQFVAGQLIKDGLGDPTTITLLADEQLVVTYTLEWTYPNEPVIIGTGSVTDEDSNTINYDVWYQPYFVDQNVGETSTVIRSSVGSYTHVLDNTGSTINGTRLNAGNSTFSHDGAGNATITTALASYPPSSFNSTAIKYVAFMNGSSPAGFSLNTTSRLISDIGIPLLVEFGSDVTKTASQSLELSVEATFTV